MCKSSEEKERNLAEALAAQNATDGKRYGTARNPLQDRALGLFGLGRLRGGVENGTNSLVKNTLEVSLRQSGTLDVFVDDFVGLVDLLDVVEHVLVLDRLHVLLGQGGPGGRVISKIDLGTDEDDGSSRRVVGDLGEPLCGNVIVRRRAHDGETDEEHIGLGIGQGPESIIILLTCSVPKTQADRLAIDNDASRVVVKHSRDVLSGESIRRVRDQKTGLADGTVTGHDTLQRLHSSLRHFVPRFSALA